MDERKIHLSFFHLPVHHKQSLRLENEYIPVVASLTSKDVEDDFKDKHNRDLQHVQQQLGLIIL